MELNVKYYKESNKVSLKRWLKDYNDIKEGVYKYDGSMPISCTNSLVKYKLETCIMIESVLGWYEDDELIQTSNGYTQLGYQLQRITNSHNKDEQMQIMGELYCQVRKG
jgi:hypothetical protein